MFYNDDMRTGGGGVSVAGAVAGDAIDTTGATLEGATDVGTVVTGVMMAPAGIASPGTMSTTSYRREMPHSTAIARCRAQISGLYNKNFGLMKHKYSLCT